MTWWKELVSGYHTWVNDLADSRTVEWPMVKSPWNPILVVSCYLYLCINVRSLTQKMPTYQLKSFIIGYNALMVALSSYMACEMAGVCWLYYFSKYIELTETAVFALRKKYNQISVLHVYHHSSMIIIWWLAVKFIPGGQSYIFGAINSFVHSVMYAYYGLSAFGPWIQKYLWWKKYITMLQLSQFVILFFYCIRSILNDCGYAKWMCGFMIGYAITLLTLFLNFYIKTYIFNSKIHKKGAVQNGNKKIN